MKKIYILIPRMNNDGPVRGAIALANKLHKNYYHVRLIICNGLNIKQLNLNSEIDTIYLKKNNDTILGRISRYRNLLKNDIKLYNSIYSILSKMCKKNI